VALVVLKLDASRRVVTDDCVLPAAEWRALQQAQEVVSSAQAAVDDARRSAEHQCRAEMQELWTQKERQLQTVLLLKALSLQVEFERQRQELMETFVQSQITSLSALLAGPLPQPFFERTLQSARQWVGETTILTLHVSPPDEAAARGAVAVCGTTVALAVDADLQPGQCYLQTPFGRLQAALDVQLDALQEAMRQWWQPA
jgi:flagellar assembly protein FliH